jgi:malate dehydrogenase (oxaloacetate-decarboxylating)
VVRPLGITQAFLLPTSNHRNYYREMEWDLMSNLREEALELHRKHQGKLEAVTKVPVRNAYDLSLAYSPGVAEPCKDIFDDKSKVYDYTMKGNLVAVVSDGTAVLGLGNIGPEAAMPVMEGKAVLFKSFAGVDAFPICLNTTDVDKIVETVKLLEPTFGGVNLEDIAAPACFEIEERLKRETNIPIFHDDQHGTAIVTAAGLINALRVVDKKLEDIRVVANGAGAAGIAIMKLLISMGVKEVIMVDTKGIVYEGRPFGMNPVKEQMAKITNRSMLQGDLADAMKGADVFIGVSVAGAVTQDMVRSMNRDPIIFAMANPVPEIMPQEAKEAGAAVIGTGRSDFPNQVNNVLAFPGIFRGALDVRATEINEEMKLAAVYAIADLITPEELTADKVIPSAFDPRVAPNVAAAVAKAAMETGVARITVDPEEVKQKTTKLTAISYQEA